MSYDEAYSAQSVPIDFHPALLYPLQLLVIVTASFTRPKSSIRCAAVFLSGVLTWSFHKTCHNPEYFVNNVPKQFIGTSLTSYFFLAIERLLIGEWYFDAGGPTTYKNNKTHAKVVLKGVPKRVNASIWDRMEFAMDILFSPRSIGKPWQIKNVANYDDKNPSYVPSRGRFLVRTTIFSVCLFLVADFTSMMPAPEDGLFGPRKVPLFTRLSEVTAEELIIRFFANAAFYVNTYIVTSLVGNVCALLSVGTGMSSPASWRPTYGSLSKAYTVRKFWG
ncbi:hypothetical protein MMC17_002589 [Xylographa soralifera]|nr:hypothetical protein [Xylographa soralifera]